MGLHGEGTTTHAIKVRLHFGVENIDETHTMSLTDFFSLIDDKRSDDQTSFDSTVEDWINNNASNDAIAETAAFQEAAWTSLS